MENLYNGLSAQMVLEICNFWASTPMALGRPGSALTAKNKNGPVPLGWDVEMPQFRPIRRDLAESQGSATFA